MHSLRLYIYTTEADFPKLSKLIKSFWMSTFNVFAKKKIKDDNLIRVFRQTVGGVLLMFLKKIKDDTSFGEMT
jgi:hypothetical protein